MKKFLAIIMAVAMIASLSSVLFAADEKGPSPVAAYDFTGKKLSDTSAHKLADVVIAEETDATTDADRVQASSARAQATDNGVEFRNGFVRLPDNIFSDTPADQITGLTVSMTLTKIATDYPGNEWSENLFAFASEWIPDAVGEDSGDDPARAASSFYCSYNGNVGTAKRPYSGQGNWMDGSLGGMLPNDETHTVTVTYDVASNTAIMYLDGELVHSSADTEWEVKCSMTAEDIHNLKAAALGHTAGGNWGYWGFMTVKDFTAYTSPLTADQVKTLATSGWQAVASGATPPPATEGGTPSAPQTGFATVALAVAAIGSGAYVVSKKRH